MRKRKHDCCGICNYIRFNYGTVIKQFLYIDLSRKTVKMCKRGGLIEACCDIFSHGIIEYGITNEEPARFHFLKL